jgi:hypothetical protein
VRPTWLLVVLLAVAGGLAAGQEQVRKPTPPLRHTVSVTAGVASPLARSGIREYWRPGPAVSMSFAVAAGRYVFVGIGIEAAKFRFDASRFSGTFPDVTPEKDDIYWVSVSVGGKLAFLPGMRTNPYVSGAVGMSRMTEALHRVVDRFTRQTYYDVGGTTRFTATAAAGTDIFINRAFALEFEVRAVSIHNDPDFGLGVSGQAGLHFAF